MSKEYLKRPTPVEGVELTEEELEEASGGGTLFGSAVGGPITSGPFYCLVHNTKDMTNNGLRQRCAEATINKHMDCYWSTWDAMWCGAKTMGLIESQHAWAAKCEELHLAGKYHGDGKITVCWHRRGL